MGVVVPEWRGPYYRAHPSGVKPPGHCADEGEVEGAEVAWWRELQQRSGVEGN